ncbi:BREX-1 system adenine-specific DNA-methyltransferase PglX [Deinococcus yavapaiensis]|uniref:site-specific DNA-methyltransferase (adenine-specific) n=1 Tax=Deinococcus yavapaiensis KR-236 TaxID=694435 RepID=A0A318SJA9_9DEIO|nr:BREX-1 system adenine-specific DNA-methyltransferase PglX [Deinococcus yavapaiensis]PYE52023.1 N-6 DNA methylase [Deinococcus yavapaiensis KR-236]
MNRSAIKKFATWARVALRDGAKARLSQFGITEKGVMSARRIEGGLIIGDRILTLETHEVGQYHDLLAHLARTSYAHVVDEIAYTWFNRIAALRYMELNDLSERVLSSSAGGVEPDLLVNADLLASSGDLEGVTLVNLEAWRGSAPAGQEREFVYRKLLVAQSRALRTALPFLFEGKLYLELFTPANLLHSDGVLRRMITDIPEEDWQDIEIVGWLYQFYISDRKDEVMGQKGKYAVEDIPAATQLFTPHWIVRYMVENSLGRVWLEAHPDSTLREYMPYYLESENEPPPANPDLRPEDLKVMDPACGSGHILVYAFDLLAHIYRERGYSDREIPELILTHNLHGVDIDERAAQLASFAVTMKAAGLNRRVLRRPPNLNVAQVKSTRGLNLPTVPVSGFDKKAWEALVTAFRDADHLGSLIMPPEFYPETLRGQLKALEQSGALLEEGLLENLNDLLKQAELLQQKYDAVVANPPYMGSDRFHPLLYTFIESHYRNALPDLYAAMMLRCISMTIHNGVMSMINQSAWIYLSTFKSLRKDLIGSIYISNLLHLGTRTFPEISGEVVQNVAFCVTPSQQKSTSLFIDLTGGTSSEDKRQIFLSREHRYRKTLQEFTHIDGYVFAYWLSAKMIESMSISRLKDYGSARQGIKTGDNTRFLRYWYEVNNVDIQSTWYYCTKGGPFRRWYGNNEYVLNWKNSGREIRNFKDHEGRLKSRPQNTHLFFKMGFTWSSISSGPFSARYTPEGFTFESTGSMYFPIGADIFRILGYVNSKVAQEVFKVTAPDLHYTEGALQSLPYLTDAGRDTEVSSAIEISKHDWDNFENSWDFQTHPLLRHNTSFLFDAFAAWQQQSEDAFQELKRLEEENNRYWIDAYGLQDELTPDVPDEQITIRHAHRERDAKSLISYAVGCMMGRYSLDMPGLVHAGQPFNPSKHTTFPADKDGILPITSAPFFEDDLAARFTDFLRIAYGPEKLEENLRWIAESLGLKGNENARDRIRRYFVSEFVSDHVQTYKKRPIYWLFTSGKRRAFGAFMYLHRYTPDTLARLRTDYLLELQVKLEAELTRAVDDLERATGANRKKAETRVKDLRGDLEEIRAYQAKVQDVADRRIELDLDDGVAYNYTRFKGLVYEGADLKMADLEKKAQWKLDLLAQQAKPLVSTD